MSIVVIIIALCSGGPPWGVVVGKEINTTACWDGEMERVGDMIEGDSNGDLLLFFPLLPWVPVF